MFSGKDTACQHLIDVCAEHGLTVVRRGFADALKTSAARALGAPVEWDADQCRAFCDDIKENGEIHVRIRRQNTTSNAAESRHVENEVFPPGGLSGRQYLQYYGTEAHRDVFGSEFWVDALLPQPDEPGQEYVEDQVDVLAVSDVRFPNEAQRIKDFNGSVVRLVRGHAPVAGAHVSESGVSDDLVTHEIHNNGDGPETLRPAIEALARELDLIS